MGRIEKKFQKKKEREREVRKKILKKREATRVAAKQIEVQDNLEHEVNKAERRKNKPYHKASLELQKAMDMIEKVEKGFPFDHTNTMIRGEQCNEVCVDDESGK